MPRIDEDEVQNNEVALLRPVAMASVKRAAADLYNKEYGLEGTPNAYTVESVTDDEVPLAMDLVTFVLWLRNNTDFFAGPGLDQHHPEAKSPEFTEVLSELALLYTGE